MGTAVMPVSSRTSRRAASSGFSPGSTSPLGRHNTGFGVAFGVEGVTRLPALEAAGDAEGSSMAAIHQLPSLFRRTTPPAEISRTITSQLSRNTGVSSRPAGVIVTITVPLGLPNVMLSSTLVLLQPSIELWHLTC